LFYFGQKNCKSKLLKGLLITLTLCDFSAMQQNYQCEEQASYAGVVNGEFYVLDKSALHASMLKLFKIQLYESVAGFSKKILWVNSANVVILTAWRLKADYSDKLLLISKTQLQQYAKNCTSYDYYEECPAVSVLVCDPDRNILSALKDSDKNKWTLVKPDNCRSLF
jgi:hypothetical protein